MKDELLTNFIPLNRDFFEHDLWKEKREFSRAEAWLYLIKEARFEDTRVLDGNIYVEVKRGQIYVSIRFMTTAFGWGKKRTENFLKFLESENMIKKETLKETRQSLITVCNYDRYNVSASNKETSKETRGGQQGDSKETKSNTVNTDNNISIYIRGEEKFLKRSLFDTLDTLLNDEYWIEIYLKNNGFHPNDKELFCDYLKSFFLMLQDRGESYKDGKDAKQHFTNWLRLLLDAEAEKQARKKQTGGGHSRNQSQPISKVGSMLDIIGELLHPQN